MSLSHFLKLNNSSCVNAVHLFPVPAEYTAAKLFTYADRRAGLPVVSVIHLYAGYFVVSLELISRVALKGHGIPRLTAVSAPRAVHRYTWVPAGCSYGAWREVRQGQSGKWGKKKKEKEREQSQKSGSNFVCKVYVYWTNDLC